MPAVDLPRPTAVPESIPRARMLAMLDELGIPWCDLKSFSLHPHGFSAEFYAQHPETGKRYLLGHDEIATHVITIPITDSKDDI